MIKRLMNEKGLSSLSSNYPALGAVNDQIQKLRNESIIVDYQYQKLGNVGAIADHRAARAYPQHEK